MLKLRKIQILGFKSFSDKTEVVLPGQGIAVVVGPNGCGKSNILDGVTWVLGEQSAKSLRGGRMEDVIFAGTRDRRSLGMAEVSITLIDPELTETPYESREPAASPVGEDWDEAGLRATKAAEVEQIIAASQPGPVLPEAVGESDPDADAGADEVVLKIRRRKFQRSVQRGEIVVTRRLFRTGESEYLLNGKLCRLSDIRDIFMGTGLGPESYAIIGQERIGQLLSSKPHDRRAIIEEAAGITRFKTKKRLAELRLEQARENLARIDDIFDEVAKQLVSLRRQAAKAERYGALRDELRAKLRVVLGSKLVGMDEEAAALAGELAALTQRIDAQAASIAQLDDEVAAGQQRGFALDAAGREQGRAASESAVELERARSRRAGNEERIAELVTRAAANTTELAYAREQLTSLGAEREQQQQFLHTAAEAVEGSRARAAQRQAEARTASAEVGASDGRVEAARREANTLLHRVGQVRREQAQAEEALLSVDRDRNRLETELAGARRELDALGAERGHTSMRLDTASESLRRLEAELAALRGEVSAKRAAEQEARRRGDGLRSERATVSGRCHSLESLLREHSYSTETVKKLLKAPLAGGLKPVGTLADFVEVGEQYETVVEEFLRDELNYIVVKSWDAADEGMRLLRAGSEPGGGKGVEGRATFLVHPDDAQAKFSFAVDAGAGLRPGRDVVGLKDCIRVLDGFGKSLEVILPKLRDGYVTPDAEVARTLALENPDAFFLAPSGECFHNVTVTGGKPRAEGPLALKRELRDARAKLAAADEELLRVETEAAALGRSVAELTRQIDSLSEERRRAERDSAHEGAALRQMDGERQRLERRLAEWTLQGERAQAQRAEKAALSVRLTEEITRLEEGHAAAEAAQGELQRAVAGAREARDRAHTAAAEAAAELAGVEERRRGAEANFERLQRLHTEAERRRLQLEQQLAAAGAEQARRVDEKEALAQREAELCAMREAAEAEARRLGEEARSLRAGLLAAETQLKELRGEADRAREQRATRSTAAARLAVELTHLEEASVTDLGVEGDALRAGELARLTPEQLPRDEEACREMKRRLEAMGPVNMLALEEYEETASRHSFLETQRKDLLDSIENTRSTIRELDGISRLKFDEAFARINENFSEVFARLFGGGQASMRMTDEENANESGIDIVAQPPGKKLQNVFLLSGGEKALTALSLLMGIFRYQPAPFCVLDEVDAPLDETNVGRLAEMLRSMATDTQFVMVTHSKRMMTAADMIYGVTMQEPGVSKIVSVRMNGSETGMRGPVQRQLALQ